VDAVELSPEQLTRPSQAANSLEELISLVTVWHSGMPPDRLRDEVLRIHYFDIPDEESCSVKEGRAHSNGPVSRRVEIDLGPWELPEEAAPAVPLRRHDPLVAVVPSLGGMAKQAAISKLTSLGVTPILVEEYSDAISVGIVIDTDPASGQLIRSDESVILRVSGTKSVALAATDLPQDEEHGEAHLKVPNVVDFTLADAQNTLQGAGFKVKTVEQPSDAVPQGAVIDQAPRSGAELTPGTTITLTVSTGPSGDVPPWDETRC
jgi:serine/threonine-protein kinase